MNQKSRDNFKSLLGKTIEKVVVHDDISEEPCIQIFLQFKNGTHTEFYSSHHISVTKTSSYDVLEYTKRFPGGTMQKARTFTIVPVSRSA